MDILTKLTWPVNNQRRKPPPVAPAAPAAPATAVAELWGCSEGEKQGWVAALSSLAIAVLLNP